jgi:hypothetical protein
MGWANVAYSQAFAIVSPEAARGIHALAGTMEGRYSISKGNEGLDRTVAPLAHVHVEGTLPHHGTFDESAAALGQFYVARDLALAYRLTGDRKYLLKADEYLYSWVSTYQLSLNPIDESGWDFMILTYDLCREDLPPEHKAAIVGFLRRMVDGYLASIASQRAPDIQNWQSHRIELITLGAFALNDPRLIASARIAFQNQVAANIKPDGSVVDFAVRDALHYVTYDLNPLLMAAVAAHRHGEDWFHWKSSTGSSLSAAVEWIMPYANGQKTHEEFVHSPVPFDQQRAQAKVAGFGGTWDPKEALTTVGLALPLDPSYKDAVAQMRARPGYYMPHWIVLAVWP